MDVCLSYLRYESNLLPLLTPLLFRLILYSNTKVPLGKDCRVLVCILPLGCRQMKCMSSFWAMIGPYFITFSDSQFSTQLHLSSLVRHTRPNTDLLSSTFSFSLSPCFNFYPETLNCSKLKTQSFIEFVFADFSLSTWNIFVLLLQLAHSFSFLRFSSEVTLLKKISLTAHLNTHTHKGIPLLRWVFLFWVSVILCHWRITTHFNYLFTLSCLLHRNMISAVV